MKPKTLASLNHTSHVQELNKSLERLKRSVVFVGIASGSKKMLEKMAVRPIIFWVLSMSTDRPQPTFLRVPFLCRA